MNNNLYIKNMKLIYLHQYFKLPNETGGTRSYDLATSFVKMGIDVTIVTATSDKTYKTGKRWEKVERDGLTVYYTYLPYSNQLSYFRRIIVFFQFLWRASIKVLRLKGDMVLATSTPLTIGVPALIKYKLHKTPYIFEVRDVWPEAVIAIGAIKNKLPQKILYELERVIYKNSIAIIPLSTDMQKSIITRYPKFEAKAKVVVENISEISRFQNTSKNIDLKSIIGFSPRFSVLYAGTFGRVNGIQYVIELAKLTLELDDKIVYILMGKGADKENIIKQAEEAGVLDRNVFILPPVSKNELPSWYKSISMGSSFVIPIKELWANSANKFFDTLAAGKPILINHEGWQSETIKRKNIGYVLPQKITKDEARKFVQYTQNHELIIEQESNALKTAIECYSLEKATEKYLSVFKDSKQNE